MDFFRILTTLIIDRVLLLTVNLDQEDTRRKYHHEKLGRQTGRPCLHSVGGKLLKGVHVVTPFDRACIHD